ncbi:hypothetical protein F4055_08435, partial [Candidatus Poribacteria bacterium]|nr:hypothetical protein [Candidatus Poribacteria bacterium]
PTEVHETVDAEFSFEQNLLPILTARCALAGCHVADGPHGLDFRTYESFIAGGEHPAFIAGNAEESEVVEQIASGNMPPGGPPLTDAEIQLFVDWINQQEAHGDTILPDDGHDVHDHMVDDHDDDDDNHNNHNNHNNHDNHADDNDDN